MRFIHFYLIGYFILIAGAALALWQAGVLERISGAWIAISAVIVIGVGIILAVSAGRPAGCSLEAAASYAAAAMASATSRSMKRPGAERRAACKSSGCG